MKKTMLVAVTALTMLFAATVTIPVDFTQSADALKASGIKNSQYGEATKNKVCGDRLCSEIPPEERQTKQQKDNPSKVPTKNPTQTNFNEIMNRMDKVHEKHQSQMMQMWQTMTPQEQSKMMQEMTKMIEKMEGMDMSAHMSMMKDMMQDKAHTKSMDQMMQDGKHTESMNQMMHNKQVYNETLNPRQIDFPNVLGFNDLHIHANRHLDPERSLGPVDHLLQTIVHHHCKVYDDMTAACLLFPYGMTDQDKPYGIEYVITTEQYQHLPEEEKQYWHYHKTEFPRADATFPDLTDEELKGILPILDETYGKVYYFWSYGDTYPIGEPYILVVQDLPDH